MGAFFIYIFKSSICLTIFFLFFRLLLSKDTFHRSNRFILLGLMALSFILPAIRIDLFHNDIQQTVISIEDWFESGYIATAIPDSDSQLIIWIRLLLLTYLAGIIFFIIRNLISLYQITRILRSKNKETIKQPLPNHTSVSVIILNRDIAPFSWMNYIVISQNDFNQNPKEIITHELAHIRHRHSLDLLFADICTMLQWFNPAAWLSKQELQNIHEFEADENVIQDGVNAKEYQLLLIKKAVGSRLYSMANNFNHSKLKKRITMMLKEKSNPWARLKYLYVLPLIAISVTAFARPEISETIEEISNVKLNDLTAKNNSVSDTISSSDDPSDVFMVVENAPVCPVDMPSYMEKNLHLKSKLTESGRILVKFIVNKDGSLSDLSILRSDFKGDINDEICEKAILMFKNMPRWTPGYQRGKAVRVSYVQPIAFQADTDKNAQKISDDNENAHAIRISKSKETPLCILDGKETTDFKSIDPASIESITVLKNEDAIQKYGEKGKNGVILITSKK